MGTRILEIDDQGNATGTVLASSAGAYWTSDVDLTLGNERKRANAARHIARLKMSADAIDKMERRVAGQRAAHASELATLNGVVAGLPGYSVAYDGNRESGAVLVPTGLLPPEDAS